MLKNIYNLLFIGLPKLLYEECGNVKLDPVVLANITKTKNIIIALTKYNLFKENLFRSFSIFIGNIVSDSGRFENRGDRTMYERLLPFIDTIISCFKEFEYKWKFLSELPTLDLSF